MSDINFDYDQFKNEIRVAENYLKGDIHGPSSDGNLRKSADNLTVLDASRKESILQQFGRRSLASSHDLTGQAGAVKIDNEEKPAYERSFYGTSVSTDPFWKVGGRSTAVVGSNNDEVTKNEEKSIGRYSEPSEREKLINRLLVDHNLKQNKNPETQNPLSSSTYFEPKETFTDSLNPYINQNSPQKVAINSPESVNTTTSDNDDTLFFASDLNQIEDQNYDENPKDINNKHGGTYNNQPPVTKSVQLKATRNGQVKYLESPDVIKQSYSLEDDAFARLTAGRTSYKTDNWMHDNEPYTSTVPSRNDEKIKEKNNINRVSNDYKKQLPSEVSYNDINNRYRYNEHDDGEFESEIPINAGKNIHVGLYVIRVYM
jgi:hypothetical protein